MVGDKTVVANCDNCSYRNRCEIYGFLNDEGCSLFKLDTMREVRG